MVSWKLIFAFIFVIMSAISAVPALSFVFKNYSPFKITPKYKSLSRSAVAPIGGQVNPVIIFKSGGSLDRDGPIGGKFVKKKRIPGWFTSWEDIVYADEGKIIYEVIIQDENVKGKATVKQTGFNLGMNRIKFKIKSELGRPINCHIQLYGRPPDPKEKKELHLSEPVVPNVQVGQPEPVIPNPHGVQKIDPTHSRNSIPKQTGNNEIVPAVVKKKVQFNLSAPVISNSQGAAAIVPAYSRSYTPQQTGRLNQKAKYKEEEEEETGHDILPFSQNWFPKSEEPKHN